MVKGHNRAEHQCSGQPITWSSCMLSVLFDLMHMKFNLIDSMLTAKKFFSKMCFLPILHIFIVSGVIYADKILRCLFDSIIATPLNLLYGKSPIIVVLQAFCATLYKVNCFQFSIFFLLSVTK
jgi:hypothetical protein